MLDSEKINFKDSLIKKNQTIKMCWWTSDFQLGSW